MNTDTLDLFAYSLEYAPLFLDDHINEEYDLQIVKFQSQDVGKHLHDF